MAFRERIKIKSAVEIEKMRAAGQLAAQTLAYAISLVKPGITTGEIDQKVDKFIRKHNAIPAPYKYGKTRDRPAFPKSICTSINEVICHGIPGKRELIEGDIVCIDVTVILGGYHGDNASTVPVGKVKPNAMRLMQVTLESLRQGIAAAKGGARLLDVGDAIQKYAEALGYGVVEEFVGHGIGKSFHEEPTVNHVKFPHGSKGKMANPKLASGMAFTIEPMVNEGDWRSVTLPDGWTAITNDGKLSAQYEHTILIRGSNEPPEILTLLPGADTNAPGGYDPGLPTP